MSEGSSLAGDRPAPAAGKAAPQVPVMDRDFILRNQIAERYFTNQLPAKGALDFERYCRENPDILEHLRVSERVHAGVRLMEAGGLSLPWEVRPKRFWERLPVVLGLLALALGSAAVAVNYHDANLANLKIVDELRSSITRQPLDPVKATRSLKIDLDREKPQAAPSANVVTSQAELVIMKMQLGWSAFSQYRVTIDRVGQGRALVLNGLQRDSNGEISVGINTSLFGPGDYQFEVGVTNSRGEYTPQGWATVRFAH